MHVGVSAGPGTAQPMVRFDDGSSDGAVSADGRIAGCHLHGLFHAPEYRAALLASLGAQSSRESHIARVDDALDEIAAALEQSLRIEALLQRAVCSSSISTAPFGPRSDIRSPTNLCMKYARK